MPRSKRPRKSPLLKSVCAVRRPDAHPGQTAGSPCPSRQPGVFSTSPAARFRGHAPWRSESCPIIRSGRLAVTTTGGRPRSSVINSARRRGMSTIMGPVRAGCATAPLLNSGACGVRKGLGARGACKRRFRSGHCRVHEPFVQLARPTNDPSSAARPTTTAPDADSECRNGRIKRQTRLAVYSAPTISARWFRYEHVVGIVLPKQSRKRGVQYHASALSPPSLHRATAK